MDLNAIPLTEAVTGETILPPSHYGLEHEPEPEPTTLACQRDEHDVCNPVLWDYIRDDAVDCACPCHALPPTGEEEVPEW